MSNIKSYFILLFLLCSVALQAQVSPQDDPIASTNITNQIWLDYNPSYVISNRVTVYGDAGFRIIFPNTWFRYAMGTALKYNKMRLIFRKANIEEIHGGMRLFYTQNRYQNDKFEIRFFQGYKVHLPVFEHFVWSNYLRLEERIELELKEYTYYFGLRTRWLSGLTYYFNGSGNKRTYLRGATELFWTLKQTKQLNDLFRIFGTVGREINKQMRVEIDLGLFLTRQTVDNKFQTDDFVLRARFYHKIP